MMKKEANILILANAGENIGIGHLMRCKTVAAALEEKGARCFFSAPDEGNVTDKAKKADAVLLDSYDVTEEFMETLKQCAPLIYMDDLLAFPYPADLVINYNLYAKREEYEALYKDINCPRLLLGAEYAPLRRDFRTMPEKAFANGIREVLLSTGGSDVTGIMPKLLEQLAKTDAFPALNFHALIGTYSRTKEEAKELAKNLPSVQLHFQEETDLPELMKKTDLAISAAGTTLHELASAGVPVICFVTADNQIENAKAFAETGLMFFAGDSREEEMFLQNVKHLLKESTALSQTKLQEISRGLQTLEDGRGAERIAGGILSLVEEKTGGPA